MDSAAKRACTGWRRLINRNALGMIQHMPSSPYILKGGSFGFPLLGPRTGHAVAGFLFRLCCLVLALASLSACHSAESPGFVEFDDHEIRRHLGDGTVETIRWSELAEVGILTTDEGPTSVDVFWLLMNEDQSKGCAIPGGTEGFDSLLQRLLNLPGADSEAVIRAMGSTENDRFLVWQGQVSGPPAPIELDQAQGS